MTGDDGVEIEPEHAGQRAGPLGCAAAVAKVPERRQRGAVQAVAVDEQVAGVNDVEVWKIDDGIAVGVAASKVMRLDLGVAQKHGCFIGERDGRRAGLVVADDVLACVPVGNDLGGRHEVGITAGMITMVVGVHDVLDRLIGDASHLRGDEVEAVGELVVDDDDAVVGHADRDVAAGLAAVESRDDVESARDFAYLESGLLFGRKSRSLLTAGRDEHRTNQHQHGQRTDSLQLTHRDLLGPDRHAPVRND